MHQSHLVPHDSSDSAQLSDDELDVLSLLTTTVALFGLGLFSVLSLLELVAG